MRAEFHSISSISGILSVLMDFQPKFKVLSIQSTLGPFKVIPHFDRFDNEDFSGHPLPQSSESEILFALSKRICGY